MRRRAIQEGKVQASLRHPNVVAVTDIVACRGSPALVLEYVAGPSLDQLLHARRLSLEEFDRLSRGILRGAAFAHDHGVVHRDLKPGNILLEVVGNTLVPRVTDFGIAKLLAVLPDAVRTQAGAVMGTPPYMAPEQGMDASLVDERADVWALGVVLYEMATSRTPFDGLPPDLHAVLTEHGLPPRMANTIARALRVDPSERWANATELAMAWTGGQPDSNTDVGASCSPATMAAAFALRPQVQTPVDDVVSTLRTKDRSRTWPLLVLLVFAGILGILGALGLMTGLWLVR